MRGQDRRGLTAQRFCAVIWVALFGVVGFIGGSSAQQSGPPTIVPRLTGAAQPMNAVPAPPLARPVNDDVRRMRSFPEQPPVIPHSIDGYQVTLNTNRCLSCHEPEFTEGSGAPMLSLSHFTDRSGEMLSDVAPRRYFCTLCHVPQTDAAPLVPNRFRYTIGTRPEQ